MAASIKSRPSKQAVLIETLALRMLGAPTLLAEAQKKKLPGMPLVVLLCGNAAAGKSIGAIIAHEVLTDSEKIKNSFPLYVTTLKAPSQGDLLSRSIIDTDFFFYPRNSEVRKTRPFAEWRRMDDFTQTLDRLAAAIAKGERSIDLTRLYDRKSGTIQFEEMPYTFSLGPVVIISGMFAFDAIPYFEKFGIPTLRVIVEAKRTKTVARMLERNRKVLASDEKIMHHILFDLDPAWKAIRKKIGNDYDLLWESNSDIIIC